MDQVDDNRFYRVFFCRFPLIVFSIPSRKLTYPTRGKGKSSSNMPYPGKELGMLIPWRVFVDEILMAGPFAVVLQIFPPFCHVAFNARSISFRHETETGLSPSRSKVRSSSRCCGEKLRDFWVVNFLRMYTPEN